MTFDFVRCAASTPATYAGAPQSLAKPVTFLWYCAVAPATSTKYFDGYLGASWSKMGPKLALTPRTRSLIGASVLIASVRSWSVVLFSRVEVSFRLGLAFSAA